ncbi:MAG: hypothetical protein BGO00_03375 [Alphaproteobacteria bacterium 62-8]|nr:MAG: hypothetical protein BGO00_03375 [Alphaproteobacteria bacterium 62-8]
MPSQIPSSQSSSVSQQTDHAHAAQIADQFTRQAADFARSPALHNDEALKRLVDAARPRAGDVSLDVACGPGTVVMAFAARIAHATGIDATAAMLDEARRIAGERKVSNVTWHQGDVYALPFADGSFDIVSCRFAFHHLQRPADAFAEMVRVCRSGGRVVLCDGVVSGDPAKADAFNRMELFRDPSTVEFRTLDYLAGLYGRHDLPSPAMEAHRLTVTMNQLVAHAFPENDDREGLHRMIWDSVEGDKLGMLAKRDGDDVQLSYSGVILSAVKR